MKKVFCLVLAVCLACLWGCGEEKKGESSLPSAVPTVSPSPSAKPQKVKVAIVKDVDGGLNIRSAASTDGEILGLAESGDKFLLLVEEAKEGWYQVQYEGKTAFISAEYAQVGEVTLEEAAKLRGQTSSETETSSKPEDSSTFSASPSPSAAPESSRDAEGSKPAANRNSEDGET